MTYTDATKMAAYLGVTFTGPQVTQAGVVAAAVDAWIDKYLGRTWQTASPATDELHDILGDRVYLDKRPVVAITSVKTRWAYPNSGLTTLSASQYELINAAAGELLVTGWGQGMVLVSYTHTMTTVPADVGLAATMIAAAWMGGALTPGTNGVESLAVGQNDINIKFSAERLDVPSEALSILSGYRSIVIA